MELVLFLLAGFLSVMTLQAIPSLPVMTTFMWALRSRTNYRLTIGGYQNWGVGAAGNSMTRGGIYYLNGMPFSTHDRDNDR